MQEYNDYVRATRDYLRNYNEFRATVENFRDEIEANEAELALDPAAPSVKYDDDTRGGGELTPTEAQADRRMSLQGKINTKRHEMERIERMLRKLDRAMAALDTGERRLIEKIYIERTSLKQMSIEMYMTEKYVGKLARRSLGRVAGMIFGYIPEQQSLFSFFE